VRDQFPDQFLAVHRALFAARHDEALHLEDESVVRDVLDANGVDSQAVLAEIKSGAALDKVRKEHEAAVADHDVWGVPTFIAGDNASFVRLMNRPEGDAEVARQSIERVASLLIDWPDLNEFKHTTRKR
jgi:predicted DsbA family dithiol-disulfide isomerase